MGVGQPGVQGHQTGLDAEARQAEQQRALEQGRRKALPQQQQTGQHEQRAARAHNIVFDAGVVRRASVFVHHQKIGGKGHQLPVAVHAGHVGGGDDARQRGEGQ